MFRTASFTSFKPTVGTRSISAWSKVEKGPEDPILGVTVAFNKDTDARKINLGVGAYRDDSGKPYILPSVKEAENRIREKNMDHEYSAIGGIPTLSKVSQELVFGADSQILKDKRVVTVQALSGTGALRLGADFIHRHINLPESTKNTVYLPNPTWGNHIPLFQDAGFNIKYYKYYQPKTCGLDFDGLRSDIKEAPKNSIMLFHACAHNPTGVDPDASQWSEISQICKERDHFVFFDLAYQGFASGDPEKDVQPIKTFVKDGHNVAISQSYAKNFGLYGERVGALSFLTEDAKQSDNVESQLKILIRPQYSNPPITGARIVSTILGDAGLTAQWRKDVKVMADRIIGMRTRLVDGLKNAGSNRDWSHITKQIGMFCYSGMTPEQVDRLASEFHVYLTRNGRISMAGVTSGNVDYLAKSMAAVTK